MARPTVHPITERVYGDLPEFYRDADETLDYPLLRFLSLALDQLGDVADLIDRIDYIPPDDPDYDAAVDGQPIPTDYIPPGETDPVTVPPGSALVDPRLADAATVGWLAQLIGVRDNPRLSLNDRRTAVLTASGGWNVGTRSAIADAARSALTGERYVDVRPTGPWQITVYTSPDETPGGAASVLDAVEAARVRPAGTQIVHSFYAASWDTLEARYPTWDALEAGAPSWSAVEATQ